MEEGKQTNVSLDDSSGTNEPATLKDTVFEPDPASCPYIVQQAVCTANHIAE
jgi:hypothetical protein